MEPVRLRIEAQILERHFPGRHAFRDALGPGGGFLDLDLRSSAGRLYRVRMDLQPDYPAAVPRVFLRDPRDLVTREGWSLVEQSPSHRMHTLQPVDGCLQLCHYRRENWHSNVTLYKVALKCLLWIEAFENHLKTGRPLVDYLGA